jgi:hypothetical protein
VYSIVDGVQMSNVNSLNVTNPFPFTTVSLNEGDAWNSESYQFIAPVGGVYVLSYSTACLGHASSNFDLMIDGKTMYNAQVDDSHRNVDTASRTVPVSLKQGTITCLIYIFFTKILHYHTKTSNLF